MDEITEWAEIKGFDTNQMSAQGHGMVTHGDDRGLHVEMYEEAVKQGFKSKEAGRPIYKKEPFISITSPGGKSVICRKITEADKIRFPEHWANYVRGTKMVDVGTPLEKWPQIDIAQVKTAKAADVYTVEQLALAPDTVLQEIGMGFMDLKTHAKNFLKAAEDSSYVSKLTSENAALRDRLEMVEEKLNTLVEQGGAKKKPGRPRKAEPFEEEDQK